MGLTVLLLPGMDGTGELFDRFLQEAPAGVDSRVVAYPRDRVLSYEELLGMVEEQMEGMREVVVVAESFSGPLALRLACRRGERVQAVILVASFVSSPLPWWMPRAMATMATRFPVTAFGVRRMLLDVDAPAELVEAVRRAVGQVAPSVMQGRLQEILKLDASADLASCPVPVMYVRALGDRLVLARCAEQTRAIRGDVRVAEVDGPHLLLQSRPREMWKLIAHFVGEIAANFAGR